jgi:HSP20 family protein
MTDRIEQQRPANESQGQGRRDNTGLARRDDQGGISHYRGAYSPFELMKRFTEDVDRMFESFGFGKFGGMSQSSLTQGRGSGTNAMSTMAWTPPVDIGTRGDDLVVSADLPGIKPENVQIECEENHLIIWGETRDERTQDDKDKGYWYSERSSGSFYRTIPLPRGVNPDNAKANFNNGVLEVTFPGAARSMQGQRRRIEIQGGQGTQSTQGAQSTQQSQQIQSGQMSSSGSDQNTQTTG